VDLYAVMTEIATQIDSITTLRAYGWQQGTVQPPAALVGYPDSVDYAGTYGRYQTRVPDLPVLVLVGKASDRIAAKRLGEFLAETGAKSIPAKIMARAGSWVACDVVTVKSATFPAVQLAGVDYLAVEFHLDVVGKGAQ
jgi:hypothetical protein